MESNFVFTESGLVDSVEENAPATAGDNITYTLQLQKRWEGDFTAFKENDVILASVNALATGGKYYDMWMRVLSVNTVKNSIEVVCYPDNEVPSRKNYPPCELARLIRWGNAVEEDRQSCWYISSSEGLLVWLDHVTKPIIDKSNYSLAIGKLPDALHFVFANYPLADKRDGAFYAKYLAVQNIIRTDYQGNVKQDVVDRGKWSLDIAKSEEPYRCIATEVHDVWHYGCRWRCLEDKTQAEPKYASTGWAFVEGNPEFKVEMASAQGWSFDCDEISKLNDEGQYTFLPRFRSKLLSITGRLTAMLKRKELHGPEIPVMCRKITPGLSNMLMQAFPFRLPGRISEPTQTRGGVASSRSKWNSWKKRSSHLAQELPMQNLRYLCNL